MSPISALLLVAALDVAGLFVIWFALRARVRRFLDLESLLSGVREESRALVMELNETAERNVSLLEDRVRALRELLDEADRRIALVRRESETRQREREVYAKLSQKRPIVPGRAEAGGVETAAGSLGTESAVPPGAPAPLAAEAGQAAGPRTPAPSPRLPASEQERAAGEPSPSEAAEAIPLVLGGPRAPAPEIVVAQDFIVPKPSPRELALELHRKGFSAPIIAARVGATLAEIELLIEMEERRAAALPVGTGLDRGSSGGAAGGG